MIVHLPEWGHMMAFSGLEVLFVQSWFSSNLPVVVFTSMRVLKLLAAIYQESHSPCRLRLTRTAFLPDS